MKKYYNSHFFSHVAKYIRYINKQSHSCIALPLTFPLIQPVMMQVFFCTLHGESPLRSSMEVTVCAH